MTALLERLTFEHLEPLRDHTDVFGEALVAEKSLERGKPGEKAQTPPEYDYVDAPSDKARAEYHALIDQDKVRHAQRFFATFGLQILGALVFNSLPDSYAAARGAQVLYLTGELVTHPARRVRETTQFLLTIMAPAGGTADSDAPTTLHPGKPGANAARSLRIFHQYVRNLIANNHADRWNNRAKYFKEIDPDGPALGKPVNQEDLLGTLLEFSVGVFECMDALGVPYTDDDKAAWFHVWDVVGRHMGVGTLSAFEGGDHETTIADEAKYFLPLDPKLSDATLAQIRRRHRMATVEGSILVNALLAELERPLQRGMKPLPASLMRYLLGNETANALGISRGGWPQQLMLTMNSVPRIANIVKRRRTGLLVRATTSELSAIATQALLRGYVDEGLAGGKKFVIPSHLLNSWGISAASNLTAPPKVI